MSAVEKGKAISKRHLVHLFLGILVTLACLYFAVKDIDWQEVAVGFSQADYRTVPLYLLFLALFFWLKGIRWTWLIRPVKQVSFGSVFSPMMIGFMGNNVLPAHLGEIFRVVLLGRKEQIPYASVFSSIAIERLLDVFAVLLLVGLGMLTIEDVPEGLKQAFLTVGIVAAVGVFVLAVGLIWLSQAVRLANALIGRLPLSEKRRDQLGDLVQAAATGTTALKDWRLLIAMLVNSVVQWGCNCIMIYYSLWSFGIEAPFSATLVLLGVLVFAVTIPSSPGFFGAIQLAFVKTLSIFGVSEGSAFAASIYYHLLQYLAVTGVGLWCLWGSGFTLTRLTAAAEEIEEKSDSASA